MPDAQARDALVERARAGSGAGRSSEVESIGSWPATTSRPSAASATVVGEGPDLVERAREGDQPVAGDDAVGRLHADDPAQRGRLADRAARVGAEGKRHHARPPPRPRCRPRSRPGRASMSQGLRVGPKAEFSVEEPMANSSRLVLPTAPRRRARSRLTTVAS